MEDVEDLGLEVLPRGGGEAPVQDRSFSLVLVLVDDCVRGGMLRVCREVVVPLCLDGIAAKAIDLIKRLCRVCG